MWQCSFAILQNILLKNSKPDRQSLHQTELANCFWKAKSYQGPLTQYHAIIFCSTLQFCKIVSNPVSASGIIMIVQNKNAFRIAFGWMVWFHCRTFGCSSVHLFRISKSEKYIWIFPWQIYNRVRNPSYSIGMIYQINKRFSVWISLEIWEHSFSCLCQCSLWQLRFTCTNFFTLSLLISTHYTQ